MASGLTGRNGARAQSRVVTARSSATARVTDLTMVALTALAISTSLETALPDCVLVGTQSVLSKGIELLLLAFMPYSY